MAELVVYAETTDRTIGSSNGNHATMCAGSALFVDSESQAHHELGDSFFSPTYYGNEVCMAFDASAIPDDATIDAAVLALYGKDDQSATDFTIEVAAYDFGASVDTSDWRNGTQLGALSIVASRSTSGWTNAGYNDFSDAGSGLASIVSKSGLTKVILWPQRIRTGSAPANSQFVQFWSAEEDQSGERRPRLTITYTEAASDAPQQLLGWGLF